MKWIRFERQGKVSVGMAEGGRYIDLEGLLQAHPAGYSGTAAERGCMRRFLNFLARAGSAAVLREVLESLNGRADAGSFRFESSQCRLLAPVHNPGKIICLGLNYADHAAEQGKAPPDLPMIFAKFATAIVGPGDPVVLPSRYTQEVDYEVELAVIIGRACKEVPEDRAMECVAGYTVMNDVTARDFQARDKQWVRGKSCDTFAPMGPYLVTADEVPDPHQLRLKLILNGEVRQDSSTSQLVFNIPFLIAYLSRTMTLEPGDVISTGTPPGVGVYRDPPSYLKGGDVMEAFVEGIGSLVNPVVDPGA